MATVCQLSYPLNSENASPFGTRTVYLAWPASCAYMARSPSTASIETAREIATITPGRILLLFITTLLVHKVPSDCSTLHPLSSWRRQASRLEPRTQGIPVVIVGFLAAGTTAA